MGLAAWFAKRVRFVSAEFEAGASIYVCEPPKLSILRSPRFLMPNRILRIEWQANRLNALDDVVAEVEMLRPDHGGIGHVGSFGQASEGV